MPPTPTPAISSPDSLGFVEVNPTQSTPCLTVAISAAEKTGKTFFGCSGPGDVAIITFDAGTHEGIQEWMKRHEGGKKKKKIHMYRVRTARDLLADGDVAGAVAEWLKVKKAYEGIIKNPAVRTVVVDTDTDMWGLCRLARFGKLEKVIPTKYVEVNREFTGLLRAVKDYNKNLILISKMKKEWVSVGDKSVPSGKVEADRMDQIVYEADVIAQCYKRYDNTEGFANWVFGLKVLDSRFNQAVVCDPNTVYETNDALMQDDNNFQFLAGLCFPHMPASYWE